MDWRRHSLLVTRGRKATAPSQVRLLWPSRYKVVLLCCVCVCVCLSLSVSVSVSISLTPCSVLPRLTAIPDAQSDIIISRADDRDFVGSVVRELLMWRRINGGSDGEDPGTLAEGAFHVLEPTNSFKCRLVRQEIAKRFDDMIVTQKAEDQANVTNHRLRCLRVVFVGAGNIEVRMCVGAIAATLRHKCTHACMHARCLLLVGPRVRCRPVLFCVYNFFFGQAAKAEELLERQKGTVMSIEKECVAAAATATRFVHDKHAWVATLCLLVPHRSTSGLDSARSSTHCQPPAFRLWGTT